MSTRSNLIANYLGQGWSLLMGLALIPVYIKYLGMEAYGLIGIFAVIKAWLTLADLGMTPTLNREMARYAAGAHTPQSIRDLLHTLEVVCFGFAAFTALILWVTSDYLATNWVNAEHLPPQTIAQAFTVMGLVVALRTCESIYRGSLMGLEMQVWLNGIGALIATVGAIGALAVLAWISPTIEAFFIWQALISLISLIILVIKVHHSLPRPPLPAKFTLTILSSVLKFAGGMIGISFLSLLLSQSDKVLLSRLLPLREVGYYTFATVIAGTLSFVISPTIQAIYPRLVALSTREDEADLIATYHQGAQLITVLTAPAALLLSFFAEGAIFMWSGDPELARNTAPILMPLAIGTFLNGLMHAPYQLQLAHAWTGLALKCNILAVTILIPFFYLIVPRYGGQGAAWIWVILNAAYVLFAIHFMHCRLIPKEKWRWYAKDIIFPIVGAGTTLLFISPFQPTSFQDRWHWFLFLSIAGCSALIASTCCGDKIRPSLRPFLFRLTRTLR